MELMITATHSLTAVGLYAESTAAAVRAGISRLQEWEDYLDTEGNPVLAARIPLLADDADSAERLQSLAVQCIESLLNSYFQRTPYPIRCMYLLLGVAHPDRPGPRYEGEESELAQKILPLLGRHAQRSSVQLFELGNGAALEALVAADRLLQSDPYSICLVGGMDSLLDEETLDWLEDEERLKTVTFGRNHGLSPGEAVGFCIVETRQGAKSRSRCGLATVRAVNTGHDPAPVTSDQPSVGEGLTTACYAALQQAGSRPDNIATVMGDLNGEFFRAKEWAYVDLRCLPDSGTPRTLIHPADCIGDIGAASGAILLSLAAVGLSRSWAKQQVLIFCSDDWGHRAIAILDKG